jgi:hypothetical protein
MKTFKIAIDESGGIEPVINFKTFQPHINPQQTHCFVGAAILDSELEEDFNRDWTILRQQIANELSLESLPPIHMCLMWGKQLPRKHKGSPNPYLGASQKQILEWVERILRLSQTYANKQNGIKFLFMSHERASLAESLMRYYNHPNFATEARFLKEKFIKAYKQYHLVATSPLIESLGSLVFYLNFFLSNYPAKGILQIDNCQDTTGFDLLTVFQQFKQKGRLAFIEDIKTLENMNTTYADSPLMQLVDVKTYLYNKSITSNGSDTVVARLHKDYPEPRKHTVKHKEIKYARFSRNNRRSLSNDILLIRYELARKRAIEIAPSLNEYLIDLEEFEQRSKDLSQISIGLSVLKAEWQEMVKNG